MQDQQSYPSLPDTLKILKELDSGLFSSSEWLKTVHRSLICDAATHPEHTADDAHRHCDFGRWYYGEIPELLANDPAFQQIELAHQSMHDAARTLLTRKGGNESVPPLDYDAFMDQAIAFKREIRKLQFDLINRVCIVDHLTGAWNRTGMCSRIAQEQERMIRTGEPCSICMMDLDHFKRINDQHDHAAGDLVLQATVQFVTRQLRKYDSIFRYGGEEFLLCLPNTDELEAKAIMNRLREELALYSTSLPDGSQIRVTASFGIAPLSKDKNLEESITLADHALLCAKASGRNQVCVWKIGD